MPRPRAAWWRPPHEAYPRRQRLRRQVRQRQRFGLGVGQRAVCQGHHPHGRAGQPAQHLPQQHPGPAHLVRGAHQREGLAGPARRHRPDGGDEPANLDAGRARARKRRLPVLRLDAAAAAECLPRRRGHPRHADHRDLQCHLRRPASAPAVQEHPLRRRVGAIAGHRHRGDRGAVRRAVPRQGKAARIERARAAPGARLRRRASAGRGGRAARRKARSGRPAHPRRRQHRRGTGLRIRRRHGLRLVPDHTLFVGGRGLPEILRQAARGQGQRRTALRHRAGRGRDRLDRHGHRSRLERRARLHRHIGPGRVA